LWARRVRSSAAAAVAESVTESVSESVSESVAESESASESASASVAVSASSAPAARGASGGAIAAALSAAPSAALVLALVAQLAMAPRRLDRGVVYAHPAMISAVWGLASAVPTGELVVVSERHLAFMATWYTRARTRLRPPAPAEARQWRLLPLAFIVDGSPLSRAIDRARAQPGLVPPRGLHPRHRNGLVLMPEATWEWVLAQLPSGARRRYQAWKAL
jgi:hypothetical protein